MLIQRGGSRQLEIMPGSVRPLDAPGADAPPRGAPAEDLGVRTLAGEIVDSKCFLGVMNPGSRKVHRACAVRCISGGIPPLLFVRDPSGAETHYYLTGPRGEPIGRAILDRVAEPVEATGRASRLDGLLYLSVEPGAIRRAPG
jgi:hypothetical protein